MIEAQNETSLLSALGIAVLERGDSYSLSAIGVPPPWLSNLLGITPSQLTFKDLVFASPFLADFFREAEHFWLSDGAILKSGTWSQRNLSGEEAAYEAWAVRSCGRKLLVLRLLEDFEERRAVFQKAREMALSHELLGRKHRELSEVKDALEMRNREVERVNELKSDFLASVSHELRTPLNAIIGFSTLLEEERAGSLNAEQHDYMQRVSQASRHLLALINDILDLSKIEAGYLELRKESFTFSEALAEVLSTIRPLARARNINLVTRCCYDDRVYADRLRFKQILYNLLNNAIKFTPEFGEVAIECSRDGESIGICVTDNGIGIPAEEQEAIFEKFHQAHSPLGTVREGTGLGLAITRQIVEHHGGKIWVESRPGYTRFSLRLPGQSRSPGEMFAYDDAASHRR